MHGLIFETSIWLLAGSTRLFHHKLAMRATIRGRRHAVKLPNEPSPPMSRCGWCCKSRRPQLHTQQSGTKLPKAEYFKTPAHMPSESWHAVSPQIQARLSPDKCKWQMVPVWLSIAPRATKSCPKTWAFNPQDPMKRHLATAMWPPRSAGIWVKKDSRGALIQPPGLFRTKMSLNLRARARARAHQNPTQNPKLYQENLFHFSLGLRPRCFDIVFRVSANIKRARALKTTISRPQNVHCQTCI